MSISNIHIKIPTNQKQNRPTPIKQAFAQHCYTTRSQSEKKLWRKLRKMKLGYKFFPQFVIGGFIADFACSELGLIIEVDGLYHQPEQDKIRDNALIPYGFHTLRFKNDEVMQNMEEVLIKIKQIIQFKEGTRKLGDI